MNGIFRSILYGLNDQSCFYRDKLLVLDCKSKNYGLSLSISTLSSCTFPREKKVLNLSFTEKAYLDTGY